MHKGWWLIICGWLLVGSVSAQPVGDSTQEILDNVSSMQKPQSVQLQEETCKILGIFNCPQPKVDYTHSDLLPKEVQFQDRNLSFWQQIGSFFKGLFEKSSNPKTGYGYSYLPKRVNPVEDVVEGDVAGISLETATEQTHETIKKSFLPYALTSKLVSGPTKSVGGSPKAETGSVPEATVPLSGGSNTVEYAKALVTTAGKSCGWSTVNVRTKTLSCSNCEVPTDMNPVRIDCLSGKVSPDVYFDLARSANGNSWLQCVGFVIAVEQSAGRELPSRNAKDYCLEAAPAGYKKVTLAEIQAGDIVASTVAPWGHIMVIVEVLKGARAYKIAEANWTVSGSMAFAPGERIIYDGDINCVLKPLAKAEAK